jgi:hypothetical protein
MRIMQEYFDPNELKANYEGFKTLIEKTVKRLAYIGVLHLTGSEEHMYRKEQTQSSSVSKSSGV